MHGYANIAGSIFSGSPYNALTISVSLVGAMGALGTLYLQRVQTPTRRLEVFASDSMPLNAGSAAGQTPIAMVHNGVRVSNPRITSLEIRNSGRSDLPSAQYDQDLPLEISLGVDILEAVCSSSGGSSTFDPQWRVNGRKILVGPSLLPKRSVIRFQVLTDGETTPAWQVPLIDTKIKKSPLSGLEADEFRHRRLKNVLSLLWVLSIVLLDIWLGRTMHEAVGQVGQPTHPEAFAFPANAHIGGAIQISGVGFGNGDTVYVGIACGREPAGLIGPAKSVLISGHAFDTSLELPKSLVAPDGCTVEVADATYGPLVYAFFRLGH